MYMYSRGRSPACMVHSTPRQPNAHSLTLHIEKQHINCHMRRPLGLGVMWNVDMNDSAPADNVASQAKFVRDSSLFSITLILWGLCNAVRSFFIARILGPQGFGTWRFINIFVEYLHFASLGTHPAMQRTIPFLRGKNDGKNLKLVLNTI